MAQYIPTDPLFAQQWNLLNTGQTGFGPGNIDLNVTYVWPDYTGRGVTIAVADDGVDYNHVDLNDNYDASQHVIINGSPQDANWRQPSEVGPSNGYNTLNAHGTGMAGIAAAENNGEGMVGVAFDATLVGVLWPIFGQNNPRPELVEAAQQLDNFDVAFFAAGSLTFTAGATSAAWTDFYAALQSAVADGRDGLGTILLNSTHNGGPVSTESVSNYDTNSSQWDSTRLMIHVGGITDEGVVAPYATRSAAMLVSGIPGTGAFGSPRATVSTDITGADGVGPDDYSAGAGTTSAVSQIAGVTALILEANSDLGWRDVQEIFSVSARHAGSAVGDPPNVGATETDGWEFNGADDWNGGGRHYSIDYGYGYADALAAVRLAETWLIGKSAATSANETSSTSQLTPGATAIPDNDGNSVTLTFNVTDNIEIESMRLGLAFNHARVEDLQIVLTSPSGTSSTIFHPTTDTDANHSLTGPSNGWRFVSQEFRGELSAGTWTVTITDTISGNTGSLTAAASALVFFGSSDTDDDRYVYTNEYSDYAALSGRNALADTDGGIDTINAAAVTAASTINLESGSVSTIAGQTLTIAPGSDIENAVGGDGDDALSGNALENILYGGRGGDVLDGLGGNDTLLAGDGNDTAFSGAGNDAVGGNEGDDIVVGQDGNDIIGGDAGNDSINGGADNDVIFGGAGDDALGGGGGDDIIVGDDGNDVLWGESGDDRMNGGADTDIVIGGDGTDEIGGGTGNDDLNGGSGTDTLFGEDGDDMLNGGADADILIGGAGSDVFAFTAGDGGDTIGDFATGSDHIWFYGTDLHSFADVQSHASFNPGTGTTTISYGGGTLTLNGLALSQLAASDFIFT